MWLEWQREAEALEKIMANFLCNEMMVGGGYGRGVDREKHVCYQQRMDGTCLAYIWHVSMSVYAFRAARCLCVHFL